MQQVNPIQCVAFTLRTEHDAVTIDGKTYTTPELRAALSAPSSEQAQQGVDAWRFQWSNGDVAFMDAGETADRLRKGVVGEDGTVILNPDSGRTNWKPLVYAASRPAAAAPAVGVTDLAETLKKAPHNLSPHAAYAAARTAVAALAGAAQGAEPSALRGALEEIAAMEYDKWSNGARAGEIARNALAMQSQPIPVTGATVADRLDALADREQAGSQAASDLYAAATIWRKHLKAGVAQGAEPGAKRWNDALEVAARICESVNNHDNPMTANDCADAIRARKELPPTGTEKKA